LVGLGMDTSKYCGEEMSTQNVGFLPVALVQLCNLI